MTTEAHTDTEAAAEPARTGPRLTPVLGALALGALLIGSGLHAADSPPTAPDSAVPDDPGAAAGALPRATPTWIRIPAIDVNARLIGLDVSPTGQLDAPPADRAQTAGWNTQAVTPGQTGTAVIAGHVDDTHGPAVFYKLATLGPGTTIDVLRGDGRTAVFTTYAVRTYDRDAFPATRVYSPADRPELRVITCGGAYDPHTGYSGNTVVFARLTATR